MFQWQGQKYCSLEIASATLPTALPSIYHCSIKIITLLPIGWILFHRSYRIKFYHFIFVSFVFPVFLSEVFVLHLSRQETGKWGLLHKGRVNCVNLRPVRSKSGAKRCQNGAKLPLKRHGRYNLKVVSHARVSQHRQQHIIFGTGYCRESWKRIYKSKCNVS